MARKADSSTVLGERITSKGTATVDRAITKVTGNDDQVKALMEELNEKTSVMGQAVYAASQAQAQGPASPSEQETSSDDDVVDAEIVDDK